MARTQATAVLFDLDGVLVDSRAVVERCWRAWAGRHSIEWRDLESVIHGRPSREVIAATAPWLDAELEAAAIDDAQAAASPSSPAVAGADRVLGSLPTGSWAVVTSGHRKLATSRLMGAWLPLPDIMVCAEDAPRGKPAPEPYLLAAEALGVPPAECVVLEDAPAGVAAGVSAGMHVVGVLTTHRRNEMAAANWLIKDLTALTVQAEHGSRITLSVSTDRVGWTTDTPGR